MDVELKYPLPETRSKDCTFNGQQRLDSAQKANDSREKGLDVSRCPRAGLYLCGGGPCLTSTPGLTSDVFHCVIAYMNLALKDSISPFDTGVGSGPYLPSSTFAEMYHLFFDAAVTDTCKAW